MSAVRWALVAVGAAAILGALAWTMVTRRRQTDALVGQLGAADPRARARAGVALVEGGSRRAAKHLQEHLETEPDPRARLAIALAVAAHTAASSSGHLKQWSIHELAVSSETPADPMSDQPPAPGPVSPPVAGVPGEPAIRWRLESDPRDRSV